ncbi:MAG: MarR family winged helix-turn-helix transcriptional regulator [Propionibacteriaceae bacterium]|nr:MarR family winged helix-turn-helix transcriptional regulator [Propionibacteriaceae bacterium]
MFESLALLRDSVDDNAHTDSLSLRGRVSVGLASRYDFAELTLLGKTYVLATPRGKFTVDGLAADFAAIEEKSGKPVILATPELSAHFRRTLIGRSIPFLLGDKQAFLPFVFLNLTPPKAPGPLADFAPAAQAVFLALLHGDGDVTQAGLRELLGLSAMSVSRALAQLSDHDLIDVGTGGKTNRRHLIHVADKGEFYRAGMPHFGKALKQRIHLAGPAPENLPRSGLDALAARTMLAPPPRPVFAAPFRRRVELSAGMIDWRDAADRPDSCQIDLLAYDPAPLASDGAVDPVTMLLTLAERDERVDQAVADHMKGFPWYSD